MSGSVSSESTTPSWSINQLTSRDYPVLVGDSKSSMEFNPIKPHQARTPFNPPVVSGFGKQPLCGENGRSVSEPASSFYGPYGDSWSTDVVEKVRGERGSKRYGVWGVSMGGEGVTERAPGGPTPGPGAHDVIKEGVSTSMGKQALSHRKTAPRAGIFPDSVLGIERTERLNKHIQNIQTSPIKSGSETSSLNMSYSVGPTKSIDSSGRPGVAISDAFLITNSTIGCDSPKSDYHRSPHQIFTSRPIETIPLSPGPGSYRFDSYNTLSGDHPIVHETTLGRTSTRASAPVTVLANRGPRHMGRMARKDKVASDKIDFRSSPDRWTQRTTLDRSNAQPTEMRSPVYSSFGTRPLSLSSDKSSPRFTIRQLHVDQSRRQSKRLETQTSN